MGVVGESVCAGVWCVGVGVWGGGCVGVCLLYNLRVFRVCLVVNWAFYLPIWREAFEISNPLTE